MGCGASKDVNNNSTKNKSKGDTSESPGVTETNNTTDTNHTKEGNFSSKADIVDNTNTNINTNNPNSIVKNKIEPKEGLKIFSKKKSNKIQSDNSRRNIIKTEVEKPPSSVPIEETDNISPLKSNTLSPHTLEINNKQFDKSTSSIQIDNNVDFTVIKVDQNKNNKNNNNYNNNNTQSDSNSSTSSKKEKRRNKNKVDNDIEIMNVDDIEQIEGHLLRAQKPLGYKGDYYTLNQEISHMNNNKLPNHSLDNHNTEMNIDMREEEVEEEEEDFEGYDPNEPRVITNSFFKEDENFKLKKKKPSKIFGINNKNQKNEVVVIKNNSLGNSKHNSSNSLDCDINDIPDHGKPIKKNSNNMINSNDNGNTHPFSVF